MTRRLLTAAEVIGITGTEPPLTPADVTAVARRYYTPERAAAVFARDRDRSRNTACSGGSFELFFNSDQRGLWAHAGDDPRRAGHIPWRDLEDVLRRNATPAAVQRLAAADAAHTAHVVAEAAAYIDWRYGPTRGEGNPPTCDVATSSRLAAAARQALADLFDTPAPVQDALFTIGTPA